jgi:hypothetical protein
MILAGLASTSLGWVLGMRPDLESKGNRRVSLLTRAYSKKGCSASPRQPTISYEGN